MRNQSSLSIKKPLRFDEFNKRFDEVLKRSVNPPTKNEFLEEYLRYKVGLTEARKLGLHKDPIIQQVIDEAVYKLLLEKKLGKKTSAIRVSDKEMKSWYKRHPEIRTSHILIEVRKDATKKLRAEAKKRADEIYQEVRKSKRPFEELVKLYTDDPLTKPSGGDVGWQSKLTLYPTYYRAALKLKTNKLSGVVETPFGFHIIKLTGKKSFKEANKRQIRSGVFDEKRIKIFNDYFAKLKKQYKISVNKSLIK